MKTTVTYTIGLDKLTKLLEIWGLNEPIRILPPAPEGKTYVIRSIGIGGVKYSIEDKT